MVETKSLFIISTIDVLICFSIWILVSIKVMFQAEATILA